MTGHRTRILWTLLAAAIGLAALGVSGVALAAGDGGHALDVGAELKKIGVHAANFLLFVGLVVFMVRRPLKDFLANRRLAVARELDESARLKDEAQDAHADVERRVANMDAQLAEMMEAARKECEVEGQRARQRAEEAAAGIAAAAERTIAEEIDKARHDLRQETVELAVEMAREVLTRSVNDADHQRIASSYLDRMAEES